ncbi:MAG: bifunctional hydroxymethylpyrimidine kinase/phosphomethylpyrimidine kinase [Sphingobacterium sp.]
MNDIAKKKVPTVLSIAGFDGSGGAGIQADTKTISALGCYAMNVLTALPIQNTQGVKNIFSIPVQAVEEQLTCIFEDTYPDTIKIGMVHHRQLVEIITKFLTDYRGKIVFDPVMVSTSGHRLIDQDTVEAIGSKLFPLADVITPNLDEASVLIGQPINTLADMENAIDPILRLGAQAVLLKGGHLKSDTLTSILIQKEQPARYFQHARIQTNNTHGSGCTLSSAIAAFLAKGLPINEATDRALDYVHQAIIAGKDLQIGKGNGPLNHFFDPQTLIGE